MNFEIGALYSRKDDIHRIYKGQEQGGISTPAEGPFIFLFTGEVGAKHGYRDHFAEDGFHYSGAGRFGDMTATGVNRAVQQHEANGKRILLFQATGHGRPYIYRGEFRVSTMYEKQGVPDENGDLRKALIFVLERVNGEKLQLLERAGKEIAFAALTLAETERSASVVARTKQALFRDRVEFVEKGCRVTGLEDGRFLRASHIKPWSQCASGNERIDGNNGLLLAHHIDHLFDQGWMTFNDHSEAVFSSMLPTSVLKALGIQLHSRRLFREFTAEQQSYLDYHRRHIFRVT